MNEETAQKLLKAIEKQLSYNRNVEIGKAVILVQMWWVLKRSTEVLLALLPTDTATSVQGEINTLLISYAMFVVYKIVYALFLLR